MQLIFSFYHRPSDSVAINHESIVWLGSYESESGVGKGVLLARGGCFDRNTSSILCNIWFYELSAEY